MSRTLDRALGEFEKMPTVVGDPVVESGSNSDGEWTRWADGSQECRMFPVWPSDNMSAFGSVFSSSLQGFNYPVAFIDDPTVSGRGVNTAMWCGFAPPGVSSVTLRLMAESDRSSTLNGTGTFSIDLSGRYK